MQAGRRGNSWSAIARRWRGHRLRTTPCHKPHPRGVDQGVRHRRAAGFGRSKKEHTRRSVEESKRGEKTTRRGHDGWRGKGSQACSLLQALRRPNVGNRGLSTRASSNSRANRSSLAHSAALSEGRHVRHSVSSWPSSTLFVPFGPRAGRSKAMNASAVALSTPHWQALASIGKARGVKANLVDGASWAIELAGCSEQACQLQPAATTSHARSSFPPPYPIQACSFPRLQMWLVATSRSVDRSPGRDRFLGRRSIMLSVPYRRGLQYFLDTFTRQPCGPVSWLYLTICKRKQGSGREIYVGNIRRLLYRSR